MKKIYVAYFNEDADLAVVRSMNGLVSLHTQYEHNMSAAKSVDVIIEQQKKEKPVVKKEKEPAKKMLTEKEAVDKIEDIVDGPEMAAFRKKVLTIIDMAGKIDGRKLKDSMSRNIFGSMEKKRELIGRLVEDGTLVFDGKYWKRR